LRSEEGVIVAMGGQLLEDDGGRTGEEDERFFVLAVVREVLSFVPMFLGETEPVLEIACGVPKVVERTFGELGDRRRSGRAI
jgi:hypothetical protein